MKLWPGRLAAQQQRLKSKEKVVWGQAQTLTWAGRNNLLDFLLSFIPATTKNPLQEIAGLLAMRQAADGLPLFSGIARSRALPRHLWRLLLQVKASGLSCAQVSGLANPRLGQLGRLWHNYQQILENNNLEDQADALERLLAYLKLKGLPHGLAEYKRLQIKDSLWLRPLDMRLLLGLQSHIQVKVDFALPYIGDSPAMALLDRTARLLEQSENIEAHWPDHQSERPLTAYAYAMLEEKEFTPQPGLITARLLPGRYSEVEFLLKSARQQIEQGVLPQDIALVFPDLSIYGQMAGDVGERLGLPLAFRRSQPLAFMPLARALLDLLKLPQQFFERESFIKVLNNKYLFNFFNKLIKDYNITAGNKLINIDKWSEGPAGFLAVLLRENGYLDSRGPALEAFFDPVSAQPDSDSLTREITTFCSVLYQFINNIYKETDLTYYIKRILQEIYPSLFPPPIPEQGHRAAAFPAQLLARDWQTWQALGQSLGQLLDAGRQLRLKSDNYHLLYDHLARQAGSESPASGIQVMRLEDSVGTSFSVLLCGGLCDGEFPATSESFMLSRQERALLNQLAPLPVWRSEEEEFYGQQLRLNLLLARTSRLAVFTCPQSALDGQARQPSMWLELLMRSIGVEETMEKQRPALADVQDMDSLKTALFFNIYGNGPHKGLAKAIVAACPPAGAWFAQSPLPWPPPLAFSARGVSRFAQTTLWGLRLSATSLDTYQRCSMQWFFSYALGLRNKEEPDYELSALDDGNIVHDLLATFFKDYKAALSDNEIMEKLQAMWPEVTRKYGHTFILQSRSPIFLNQALKVIRHEYQDMGDFMPQAIEFEIPSMSLFDNDSAPFLQGRVDRIDFNQDTIRITDYKYSSYANTRHFVEDTMNQKQSLQLPLYLAAMQRFYPHMKLQARIVSVKEVEKGARYTATYDPNDPYLQPAAGSNIRELWDNLQQARFAPDISQCLWCAYARICRAREYGE